VPEISTGQSQLRPLINSNARATPLNGLTVVMPSAVKYSAVPV
jgi:hypothetical protein